MKKLRYLIGIVFVLLVSAACGENPNNPSVTSVPTVHDIISEQMQVEDSGSDIKNQENEAQLSELHIERETPPVKTEDVLTADVDLTDASATIVYGEIYNMVTMPMVYHGKTVKLTGFYDGHFDVMTDTLYCSIFVIDALACCAQGLELEFSEDYAYPEDYPTDGDEISVYGTFEIYYPDPESTAFYYHLTDVVVVDN